MKDSSMTAQHKTGCPATGGYGHGAEECICGAATPQDQQSRAEFEQSYRARNDESRLYCESEWRGWQAARALPARGVDTMLDTPAGLEPAAWIDMQAWPPIRWPAGKVRADFRDIDGMALYTAAQVLAMGRVPPGCAEI